MAKGDDGLTRNESTFNSKVWPELENLRRKDR